MTATQGTDAADSELQEEVAKVASLWWIWLVAGILWVIISLVILRFRQSSITTVGLIIGLMFLFSGAQQFVIAAIAEGWKWLWIIFGAIFVIAGLVSLFNPANTVFAFASVLGFLFLLVGVFWMIEAFATKNANPLWWLNLIAAILIILIAFWTSTQLFPAKVYMLLLFAGFWALFHGILDIVKSFQIKHLGHYASGV